MQIYSRGQHQNWRIVLRVGGIFFSLSFKIALLWKWDKQKLWILLMGRTMFVGNNKVISYHLQCHGCGPICLCCNYKKSSWFFKKWNIIHKFLISLIYAIANEQTFRNILFHFRIIFTPFLLPNWSKIKITK